MTKYNKETLESVRSVTVQRLLGLPENGRRLKIRCPMHEEKTASFTIYPSGDWCCYGQCNKQGQNALDLLIAMGYAFPQAVEYLLDNYK